MVKKVSIIILVLLGLPAILFAIFLFAGSASPAQNLAFGVTFSQPQAESLGLGWEETYLALLDDLKVRNLRLVAYWDKIEPKENQYSFEDLDWQINQAQDRGAKVILVMGRKVPRWPECYEPDWVKDLSEETKQEKILKLIENIILRYKENEAISAWQIENEPFLEFGECPKLDKEFLDKEISLARSLDPRPIVLTDSGEFSLWFEIARKADIAGTTLYRDVYVTEISKFFRYPFPPTFYSRKASLVKWLFPGRKIINVELQAEPWVIEPPFSELNLDEQKRMMSITQFRENIDFAKRTGFQEFYLWGAEWWYWLKEKQNNSSFWEEARKLF